MVLQQQQQQQQQQQGQQQQLHQQQPSEVDSDALLRQDSDDDSIVVGSVGFDSAADLTPAAAAGPSSRHVAHTAARSASSIGPSPSAGQPGSSSRNPEAQQHLQLLPPQDSDSMLLQGASSARAVEHEYGQEAAAGPSSMSGGRAAFLSAALEASEPEMHPSSRLGTVAAAAASDDDDEVHDLEPAPLSLREDSARQVPPLVAARQLLAATHLDSGGAGGTAPHVSYAGSDDSAQPSAGLRSSRRQGSGIATAAAAAAAPGSPAGVHTLQVRQLMHDHSFGATGGPASPSGSSDLLAQARRVVLASRSGSGGVAGASSSSAAAVAAAATGEEPEDSYYHVEASMRQDSDSLAQARQAVMGSWSGHGDAGAGSSRQAQLAGCSSLSADGSGTSNSAAGSSGRMLHSPYEWAQQAAGRSAQGQRNSSLYDLD
jgi:hypothetical protein